MKLNHLNLCVSDLPEAIGFFENIFEFQLLDQKGDAIAVMTDDHGFTLVLSNLQEDPKVPDIYPKDFHLGFYLDTIAEVDMFYKKLSATEFACEHPPRRIRGGYTLYFRALGGVLFEITSFS